ncbi:MAG: ABC transporter ATP-binding protein [Crenarchaeota archaeon]|nr:ABC transporter ATP-binding protein [Thermoproteota archaeon]
MSIEVVELWKRFRATLALKGVTASFGNGLNVVLGPNGSGKSTLLMIMAGLLKPSKGRVSFLGVDPWRDPRFVHENCSMYLEDSGLPQWMKGIDLLKSIPQVDWDRVERLSKDLSVESYWRRYIFTYSSGMAKKIALMACLCKDAKVYILDEPFTNLDAAAINAIVSVLGELSRSSTVIVATHVIPPRLSELISKLVILVDGSKVFDSSERSYLKSLRCPYSEKYLDAAMSAIRAGKAKEITVTGEEVLIRGVSRDLAIEGCRELVDIELAYREALQG